MAAICFPVACHAPERGTPGGTPGPRVAAPFRLACFPNLTHAQALLGRRTGAFEKTLGVPVEWTFFNAGPSAVEALFAGAIDAAYVGPNPAINGHIKSRGECFAIVAGAASGGAALVVRRDARIGRDGDFHGRIVATPQLGNTQDVAARLWFGGRGFVTRERGGDLTLIPLANPDQLLMFQRQEIDAAWTIEPWVSRLEQEAGARVYLDEAQLWPDGRYPTAVLVVRRAVLERRPDIVGRLLAAHVAVTEQLNEDKLAHAEALSLEIQRVTAAALPLPVVRSALARLAFTWDPLLAALARAADDAFRVGYLSERPSLAGIADLRLLNDVLAGRGLPAVIAPPAASSPGVGPK
jgi:NitT/TauT family transport system substrate-binding protein